MWAEAQRQKVALHTDRLCPRRRQGLSVGEYLTVAAVNRAVEPVSKRAMWDWFSQTTLRRALPGTDQAALASQSFWDHMAAIPEQTASELWQEIFKGVPEREQIDRSRLCYDGTSFYTVINTFNVHCDIARRGKYTVNQELFNAQFRTVMPTSTKPWRAWPRSDSDSRTGPTVWSPGGARRPRSRSAGSATDCSGAPSLTS